MFFTRSIIQDVEGYEFSDFRTLMNTACTFFVNIFLLFDFLILCGKTFHIRTPYPKSEFLVIRDGMNSQVCIINALSCLLICGRKVIVLVTLELYTMFLFLVIDNR